MSHTPSRKPTDARRRQLVATGLLAFAGCSGGGGGTGIAPALAPAPDDPSPTPATRRWFVDPSDGNDTAAGSSAATALRTLPPLARGDTVLLRRGTVLEVLGDYDPKAPDVVFDAYLDEGDAADLPRPVWTLGARANFIVWTGDLEGLVFRNIAFRVPPSQTGRPAFRLSIRQPLARAPLFEDCDFTGDDGAFYADIAADCRGLTFRRCSFTCARGVSFSFGRSAAVFILATSGTSPFEVTGMLWEDNRIRHPSGLGMLIRSGSSSDDDVQQFAGKFVDASFRRNRWHDCGTSGVFLRCGFHGGMTVDDAGHYGWDGLLFEDNFIENNGGSGASIGSNVRDSRRTTTIQRNRVVNNGRLHGTTGGLQLMGLRHALVQDNVCTDNWTTAVFDGVNLFMDIFDEANSEMQTAGAVGCVVRRNLCSGARGAGGSSYAHWLAEQLDNPNSSNAPSSGIRLYFAHDNQVYANLLVDNGSGVACDKSADNDIFNNTAVACTMGYYDGVGLATRANRFVNNVSFDCDWDIYGLGTGGWTLPEPTTAEVALTALQGTWIGLSGAAQFRQVRFGVGGRNFFVRERNDPGANRGLAVVSIKQSDDEIRVHVLRPFTALRYAAGELLVGAMEAYQSGQLKRNARNAARIGSVKEMPAGNDDVLDYPQLDANWAPHPSSPLLGAGTAQPASALASVTDKAGRPYGVAPAIGAFESA
jgi:parallel beta-helix repeat protein